MYIYIYGSFYFVTMKRNMNIPAPSVSPTWAPDGTHMELNMGLHMELHMEPHVELHMKLHMETHMEVHRVHPLNLDFSIDV